MTANTALETDLTRLISEYPRPAMAIVPALQRTFDGEDVTDARIETVARLCGIEVEVVRTFLAAYPDLAAGPEARPALCVGLSCYLHGAGAIRDRCREDPGVLGATTETVRLVPCLGHCHAAPVYRDEEGRIFRAALDERA